MNSNGVLKQHWFHVSVHFLIDALIFGLAFLLGTYLRLPDEVAAKMATYWPGILAGGLAFPSAIYIFGLYSPQGSHHGMLKRALIVGVCLLATLGLMFAIFYVKKSTSIGRGVMLRGWLIAYFGLLIHHGLLLRFLNNCRERVVFIVTSAFDELEAQFFQHFGRQDLALAGIVCERSYRPTGRMPVLGTVDDLSDIVRRHEIDRVLCTNVGIHDPAMCKQFCELRYSGITVMPLVNLFEEVHQMVPLELVTPEWLLNASSLPHMLYIRKAKRGFDIAASLAGFLFLGPFLLAGMALVRLTSRGPVFYRQRRCGRFGRPFDVIKLRTMRVDAEKNGAVWAVRNDPRVTWAGAVLRKYRIDEIPQLVNVLRGDMSFVGPRPERPEFIKDLARRIPFFQERLMVQPGITGWAQVNYPYGASEDDARRKLEYDLYYIKNMGLFLDVFILLDTVRIILGGGIDHARQKQPPKFETAFHWRQISQDAPAKGVTPLL